MKINELASRIVADAENKRDFIVPAVSVHMLADECLSWSGADDTHMPMNGHAKTQLAEYLKIPTRFMDRLRVDAPELIQINVNRLLETKTDDRRMVRTLHGNVRAWLSDSYRRLDNEDVAERVFPMIAEGGFVVRSSQVTETKLYMHAISPKLEGEMRVGDPVRFGWVISNSEVGNGTLAFQLFMERLRCTNGMVIPEFSKRRAHLGSRSQADSGYLARLSDATYKAQDDALWMGIRDHVKEFSTQDGIKRVMDSMRERGENPVTGDPTAVVEQLANKFLLKEEEKKSVLYAFLENNDRTRWGLANSVTQLANAEENYDRAVEQESIGGAIMALGASEWSAIKGAVA